MILSKILLFFASETCRTAHVSGPFGVQGLEKPSGTVEKASKAAARRENRTKGNKRLGGATQSKGIQYT